MKRLLFVLVAALSCSSMALAQQPATLPSSEEVLAKYLQATGGTDNYKKLMSMQAKGKMSMPAQGIQGTIDVIVAAGGKMSVNVNITGLGTEKMGGDGETYWSVSNFTGARVLEGAEREQQVMESDLQAELHSQKYFKSQTVTGTEDVGGEDCYRVERVRNNGDKQIDFFSVKTGLHVKSVIPAATPLGKIEVATMISDYREVGAFLLPFKQEQMLPGNMKQVLAMETIKINEAVAPETFALPEAVKQLKESAN